ncbi:MAG TPA: hypothetical protein PKI68_03445 [Pontiellaceae bacterium]|nr:hypothetical protein [Pontiellaceae bacterium]
MKKATQGRDIVAIEKLLNDKDPQTAGKVKEFLQSTKGAELQGLLGLKSLLEEQGYSRQDAVAEGKSYCENIVCNLAACVFSSSCSNGACSSAGCSANSGGIITPPAECKGANTCGTQACSSNANSGGNGTCGNATCSYVSG